MAAAGDEETMLERVYHHLLVSSADTARDGLDAFAAAQEESTEEGLGAE
jgi:hypothetical protein